MMLIAVNYHYIREKYQEPYPSIFGVTPSEFSEQLDILSKEANFISIGDILDMVNGVRALPEKGVVITFDDGLKEQYEIAWPIMKSKGIPGIFFVNTKPVFEPHVTTTHKIHIIRAFTSPPKLLSVLDLISIKENITLKLPTYEKAKSVYKYDKKEDAQLKYFLNFILDEDKRKLIVDECFEQLGFNEVKTSRELYMTPNTIKELAEIGLLGSHGHSHLPLGLIDKSSMYEDIKTSFDILNNHTGNNIYSFSYPFGFKKACSIEASKIAKHFGAKFAFTMERAGNSIFDEPMFLGRFSNNDVPGGKNFNKEVNTFWSKISHCSWFRSGL